MKLIYKLMKVFNKLSSFQWIYHTFTLLIFPIIIGCGHNNSHSYSSKDKIVKVVKIKSFSTKKKFDKLVKNKPVYNLEYDSTIGMDFTWSTSYFDKYNNVIKSINYILDENGVEEIRYITYKQYYSHKENKLSSIRTEGEYINEQIEYIRDDKGRLLEILKYNKSDVMTHKTVYTYNETGQRVKKDSYKEYGLYETIKYNYDTTSLEEGQVIEDQTINLKYNYQLNKYYKWSKFRELNKVETKYFEEGKLLSNLSTSYITYNGEIAINIITEGYRPPTLVHSLYYGTTDTLERNSFRTLTTRTLNQNNDILKETKHTVDIDKNGRAIDYDTFRDLHPIIETKYEYTYNNNEITELIIMLIRLFAGKDLQLQ